VRIVSFWLVLAVLSPALAASEFHLSVLHTNDVHARLLPIDKLDQTCDDSKLGQGVCFGGLARRVAKVKALRAAKQNVILLDAGDQFQGTLFYNRYKGDEAKAAMNLMRYDAMAVGNHEFDNGPANLARFVRGVDFPVLSANIDASQDSNLAGALAPYTILNVNGERIGVVGYTTEETSFLSSPGPTIRFLPIEAAVKKAVKELEAQGVNKIVAVSHAGLGRDMQVAAQVDGIDVIVGGHTHTLLANHDELAEGPTPTVVKSPSNSPVLIVSAYAYGRYLGYLDVDFDDSGKPVRWMSEPILLDESLPEDAATKAWVLDMRAPLDAFRREVIGHVPRDLDGASVRCRHVECTLGNVVADAVRSVTKPYGAQAAIVNAGGIRASIGGGDVTRWQAMDALPFLNPITVQSVKGDALWSMFEHSVSRAEDSKNEGTGRFLQVSGIRVSWDPQKPVGSRVVSLEIESSSRNYTPVLSNQTYGIAANRFISSGGDGYDILARAATNMQILSETTQECLVDYLTRAPSSIGSLEGRIVRRE
jgi:5'-nucleotidase/UDP-sugar diphosphatase